MKVRSRADLDKLKRNGWGILKAAQPTLLVGMASCGMAAGASTVFRKLEEEISFLGGGCRLIKTGCLGFCQKEPLVEVRLPEGARALYGPFTFHDVDLKGFLDSCRRHELPSEQFIALIPPFIGEPPSLDELVTNLPQHAFYDGQVRIAGRNCGQMDPENILHAFALGGYQAICHCLVEMTPDMIIRTIIDSKLRGRGGAGFSTGLKWQITRDAASEQKYVVCNADEGDPGAYMDRSLLEGDPHNIIEGMMVGAYAVGASRGVIYVRKEYPLAIQRLEKAVKEARDHGLLGEQILATEFNFELDIVEGAGAFVSGEETALIASLEGRAAEPRPRPPYPAIEGLYGCPTVINNVETWASVPAIIRRGADWYTQYGTDKSKGTKLFSLVGAVSRTGLVEVPLGTSLQTIVEQIGGGTRPWHQFKAVQTGGPSGGCIPAQRFDIPVDYETLQAEGSIMGSGGMVVLDDSSCMVDIARYFLRFTSTESCGKCTPCREGLDQMLKILEKIVSGNGTEEDLARLEDLALAIKDASLCGLGKSAPNPVLTTLLDFRDEYMAHIIEKRCPAGVCRDLIQFLIDGNLCTGCQACVKTCPAQAITGKKDSPHSIDATQCIKCGACREICPYNAIYAT